MPVDQLHDGHSRWDTCLRISLMTDRPESSPILNLPKGKMIDDYKIVELIGRGGMGAVYLATDTRKTIVTPVALKLLYPHLARKSGDFTRRFLREARIASRISHPNLVQVYECSFCDDEGLFYIAQEYIGGGSLRQLVATDTVLAEADVLRVGIGVARALEAACRHKVVHRDIKPDNIMFAADGTVKLMDWGIAKNTAQTPIAAMGNLDLTVNKVFMGTPLYASPEQLQNTRDVDIRADIYSLGATMYYALVGKPPLRGTTEVESLCVILTKPAPDVRKARPDVSAKTASIIKQMLEKKPGARQQTPTILLEALLDAANALQPGLRKNLDDSTATTGVTSIDMGNQAPPEPPPIYAAHPDNASTPAPARCEPEPACTPPHAPAAPPPPLDTPSERPYPAARDDIQAAPPHHPTHHAQPTPSEPSRALAREPQPTPTLPVVLPKNGPFPAPPAPLAQPPTAHDYPPVHPGTPPTAHDYPPVQPSTPPPPPTTHDYPPVQPSTPPPPPPAAHDYLPSQPTSQAQPPTAHYYLPVQPSTPPPPAHDYPPAPPAPRAQAPPPHDYSPATPATQPPPPHDYPPATPPPQAQPPTARELPPSPPSPMPTLADELLPELAHPNATVVDAERRDKRKQHPSANAAPAPTPSTTKRGIGLFWKLVLTIFLLGIGLIGGLLVQPQVSRYLSCRLGEKKLSEGEKKLSEKNFAVAMENFAMTVKHYQKAQEIRKLDVDQQKQLARARRVITYLELVAKAETNASMSPPDWPRARKLYEEASHIEGFEKDETAVAGMAKADNAIQYARKLAKVDDAIKNSDWSAALTTLAEMEKIPDFGSSPETETRRNLAIAEKKYRDLLKDANANNADPEKAENYYRQALAAERHENIWKTHFPTIPFDYREAADGLAGCLMKKATDLAENTNFTDAKTTLDEIVKPSVDSGAKAQKRLLESLTVRDQVDKCLQNIVAKELAHQLNTVKNNFDEAMRLGADELQGNDFDPAAEHFLKAIAIADAAKQPEWRKLAEGKLQETRSKQLDQLCQQAENNLKAQTPNLEAAQDSLQKAQQRLPELPEGQPRMEAGDRINDIDKRIKALKNKDLLNAYQERLRQTKDLLDPTQKQDVDAKPRLESLRLAVESLKSASDIGEKIREVDPTAKPEAFEEYLKLNKDLAETLFAHGEVQLKISQQQNWTENELGCSFQANECLLAEEFFQLADKLPPSPDAAHAKLKLKAKGALHRTHQEKEFLILLNNAFTSAKEQDFVKSEDYINRAGTLPGYRQDPRLSKVKGEIATRKNKTDYEILIQTAKKLETERQWEKARKTYDEALIIRDQDETARSGRERCQKGLDGDKLRQDANAHIDDKEWPEAVELLEQACERFPDDKTIAELLTTTRQTWHDDLARRLQEELAKPDWATETWAAIINLLTEANAIPGFENDTSLNTKTYQAADSRAQTAVQNKNWVGTETLANMAEQIPGYEQKDAIATKLYHALCNEGDDCLKAGQPNQAKNFFERAEKLAVADPDNRAQNGLKKCGAVVDDAKKLTRAKEDLHQECQALVAKKYIQNSDQSIDFQRCLQDCWDLLKNQPEKHREQNQTEVKQMVIENCLKNISDNLLYDLDVMALPEDNQFEAKRVFLELLNDCEKITGGAISALGDTHDLRQNVSAFFAHNPPRPLLTQDEASTMIITWLLPLVAKNHQD